MSNRTLLEINHDYARKIEENPEAFVRWLTYYLGNGSNPDGWPGIKIFGMRHHSDPFKIEWGFDKPVIDKGSSRL